MNRTKLKNYAPQARRAFIQAMTDRAALYGLTANKIEPVVEKGDVAVIGGREHPREVAKKRKQLEDRISRHGFEQTMEALAYTWFNRLVAIRFMEHHGYLEHGYRVLSHPEGKPTPEILEHAEHVELPGLKREAVIDLKLAGNKEAELYRLLLTAQCNALNTAMPFLFEKIDDETELLLPDNLLHSDSLIRKLVSEIAEEDWQEVEIIGWLYQFYISEKKDEVMGSVVASEDIPAATQLFTPNWIVKYLVQNTLGRQWLATYPQSALRQQMEYYIEPAEQMPEVQAQLKAITPTSLNPEELTLLDPACGSGHILVEAYDLFKAIYQERGYRAKDIPALILQKNLFGLEIDDRAAQLAAFAMMMKARADDRRIFDSEAKPNIRAFQDSQGMNAADLTLALNAPINKEDVPTEYLFEEIEDAKSPLFSKKALAEKGHVSQGDIASLLALFENAKTFGSLIQVPPKLAAKLPEIEQRLNDVLKHGDLTHASAHVLKPLLQQVRLLVRQYDAVVANPPYMGNNALNPALKRFADKHFQEGKTDLFACFMQRGFRFLTSTGVNGMVTMQSWMFLASFAELRHILLDRYTLLTVNHIGYNGFPALNSKVVRTVAFTALNLFVPDHRGVYMDIDSAPQSANKNEVFLNRRPSQVYEVIQAAFRKLPNHPIAYWVPDRFRAIFDNIITVSNDADTAQTVTAPLGIQRLSDIGSATYGLFSCDNERFLRYWHEVSITSIGFGCSSTARGSCRFYPYNKGGSFRRWSGNYIHLVDFKNNGNDIREYRQSVGQSHALPGQDKFFHEGVTWNDVASKMFSARLMPSGFIFDKCAPTVFFESREKALLCLGVLNSTANEAMAKMLNPTIHFTLGDFNNLPYPRKCREPYLSELVQSAIDLSDDDWNEAELGWKFNGLPPLTNSSRATIDEACVEWKNNCLERKRRLKAIEEAINQEVIAGYELEGLVSPLVEDQHVTVDIPATQQMAQRLLSYSIGCMMGRYSLDKPGLVYAHSGNQGFDLSQYKTFKADDDGIIPLLESDWGVRDDAASRIVEFIGVAWPKEHLEENLKFMADSLGPANNEQPRNTIRRYLTTGFYKHHLSMYKKRPIYWLFSSGKQRAFQCLVYLHRYNEGTLARMRTEYVIPLQGQIAARIEQLEGDKAKATSTSHRNKLQKEQNDLKKQQAELLTFEEKLKHAADQKISLDLDDGVKVNYGKFGDLLAEAKAITGGKDEE